MRRNAVWMIAAATLALGGCHKSAPPPPAEPQGKASAQTTAEPSPAEPSSDNAAPPAVGEKAEPTPASVANENAQVIVLGYHRLVDKVRWPGTEIATADFEAQMQQLKESGIPVIPLKDLLAWKRGEKAIPAKCAVITLDDGWKSQYEVAWPILKKYGFPFTLFIYTDYVKGGPKAGGQSMSWDQLAEMRDAGVEIEDHTASHRDLRGKKGKAPTPEYDAWLWKELNGSKQILEEHLGIKIRALALPYGYYNEHVKEMAKKAGYEAIFTVNGQRITHSTPADALGRAMVEAGKPFPLVRVGFTENGNDTAEAPSVLAPEGVAPADKATVSDPKPVIKTSTKRFGTADPGTFVMRISGLGVVPSKYDAATRTLSYQPPKDLPQNAYTVIVSGGAKGKKMESRWTFTVAAPPAAMSTGH